MKINQKNADFKLSFKEFLFKIDSIEELEERLD